MLSTYSHAQVPPPPAQKHFRAMKTIHFHGTDTLLIAEIAHMDVGPTGRLLVTDLRGGQVLLFDSTGTLQASLNPEDCHPGFNFRPLTAHFGGNAFIFVQNSGGRWGFRFSEEGVCLGAADADYSGTPFFDIDPSGTLYGVNPLQSGVAAHRVLRRMDASGKVEEEFTFPQARLPEATRRWIGGGLIADGAHIFYVSTPDKEILKLSVDGDLAGKIASRNRWFRYASEDLPANTMEAFKSFGRWGHGLSGAKNLFELTDETVMVQYQKGAEVGYQIFTKDGELIAEEFGFDFRELFLYGSRSLVYRVIQPGLDAHGTIPNPYLEVFRVVLP